MFLEISNMSISINTPTTSSEGPIGELLGAKLANNKQELEGQMALQLIQSASPAASSAPVGNVGNHINIKV